jgi:hypothetical protein
MLSVALQKVLQNIIPNTFNVIGDEDIAAPFCVHEAQQSPVFLKQGIAGYEYDCEIAIIAELPDSVEALKQQVRAAVEALPGTTSEGTTFEDVEYLGDGPGYDSESKLYISIVRYLIQTSNI